MVLQVIIGLLIIVGLVAVGFIIGKWWAEDKQTDTLKKSFHMGAEYASEKIKWMVKNGYLVVVNGLFEETSKGVALRQGVEAGKIDTEEEL